MAPTATWKDKGVVPDSEDEAEWDSQGNGDFAALASACKALDDDNVRYECTRNFSIESKDHADHDRCLGEGQAENPYNTPQRAKKSFFPSLSPDYPPIQADTLLPSTPNQEAASTASVTRQLFRVESIAYPKDDVSTSYVQIARVPVISPSPLTSQHAPGNRWASPSSLSVLSRRDSQTSASAAQLSTPLRRHFRPRKEIQMHPYQIEQLRYQQKMKASHIKPLRITETQDRINYGEDGNEDDKLCEYTDFDGSSDIEAVSGESEPAHHPHSSLQVSPIPSSEYFLHSPSTHLVALTKEADSDDDLPDIDEVLARPRTHVSDAQPISPFMKGVHSAYCGMNNEAVIPPRGESLSMKPASPPATSSPLGPIGRVEASPRLLDRNGPLPSHLDFNVIRGPRPEPITPATSATKSVPKVSRLDMASDGEEPMQLYPTMLSSVSPSSSSDESEVMHDIVRRSRHVLPASHFRLDLERQNSKTSKRLDTRKISRQAYEGRPGVAHLKYQGHVGNVSPSLATSGSFLIYSDDEDNSSTKLTHVGIEDEPSAELDSTIGFAASAMEDDIIDHMLPSLKRRQPFGHLFGPRKRLKTSSYAGLRNHGQPKITSHTNEEFGVSSHTTKQSRRRTIKHIASRLSILDVAPDPSEAHEALPNFMRIAARNSWARSDKGRQSPRKKYIRLATREDTIDAQSVLDDWRGGKLRPKNLERCRARKFQPRTEPFAEVADNQQTRLPSPLPSSRPQAHYKHSTTSNLRRLIPSFRRQRSMNDFAKPRHDGNWIQPIKKTAMAISKTNIRSKPHFRAPLLRPAQLESSVTGLTQYKTAAFRSSKGVLDSLYKISRARPSGSNQPALKRFLADDDLDPFEANGTHRTIGMRVEVSDPESIHPQPTVRRRKRIPRRIDANALKYRQSSELPITDYAITSQTEHPTFAEAKLFGLGEFGSRYPQHFDVIPLQAGVYFHESTFIGSGRLFKALTMPASDLIDVDRPNTELFFGDNLFRWGLWNESVSSEIGVCFDWLTETLSALVETDQANMIIVLDFILDYMHNSLSFNTQEDQARFLARMLEIFGDLATGIASVQELDSRRGINLLCRCTVMLGQLVRLSQHPLSQYSTTLAIQQHLAQCAQVCVSLLIQSGFEDVRKLCDDLQYLFNRDQGIRNVSYLGQAWVIIMRVLEDTAIPKASFWEVTYSQLLKSPVGSVTDARLMDQLWLAIFSLLPLCHFNAEGVIVDDQRAKLCCENWSLPQQLLRQVLSFYSSNSRQSASFNSYCRATVGRCHHLIVSWGWWQCGGVIGMLFDFFAAQKLAHLRNEEVYTSPHYLEELDHCPSLHVEPEDRCFHIFLKIIAQTLRHMQALNDTKGARNLVFRLLPNHDRQYPKEEAIHQRDLASLRNHHDLLCTLYWAAPPDCKPSSVLIQNLVAVDRSHKEACLINLRAWTNLARYVLGSSYVGNVSDAFSPLRKWQNNMFDTLLREYLMVESQIKGQDTLLPQTMSDVAIVERTIKINRHSIISCLQATITAISSVILDASVSAVPIALDLDLLLQLFTSAQRNDVIDADLLNLGLQVLNAYVDKLHAMEPTNCPQEPVPQDEDSQGFIWDANVEDRLQFAADYVNPLSHKISNCFAEVVRRSITRTITMDHMMSALWLKSLVLSWSRLVSLIISFEPQTAVDYLVKGAKAIFKDRHKSEGVSLCWPLFLSEVVCQTNSLHDDVPDFDIGLEWLLVMLRPQQLLQWEHLLTSQLRKRNHFLISNHMHIKRAAQTPQMVIDQRLAKDAIINMRKLLTDRELLTLRFGDASQTSIKSRFAGMLETAMVEMQQHLQHLRKTSFVAHNEYVAFVQGIASQIHSHASEICPLKPFFSNATIDYWPETTDPGLYLAKLTSYALRLQADDKQRVPLFYFLWNGLKSSISNNALDTYLGKLVKVACDWSFLEYLLRDLVPAAIRVAFENQAAWIVCEVFFVAIATALPKFLPTNLGQELYDLVTALFRKFMNGLSMLYSAFGHGLWGFHSRHQGIITAICRFWQASLPALKNYADQAGRDMDEVFVAFEEVMHTTMINFSDGQRLPLEIQCFHVQRMGNEVAVEEMKKEVSRDWNIKMENGSILIRLRDAGKERFISLNIDNGPRTLGDVLELYGINGKWQSSGPKRTSGVDFIDVVC